MKAGCFREVATTSTTNSVPCSNIPPNDSTTPYKTRRVAHARAKHRKDEYIPDIRSERGKGKALEEVYADDGYSGLVAFVLGADPDTQNADVECMRFLYAALSVSEC